MTWEPDPTIVAVYEFRDDDGAAARCSVALPRAFEAAAAAVAAQLAPLLQAVSDCVLWRYRVLYTVQDDSPAPLAGSNVHERTVLLFETESAPSARYVFAVPGVVAAHLAVAPDPYADIAIDLTAPAIAALVAAMVDGLAGVHPVAPWNPDWSGFSGGSDGTYGGDTSGGTYGDGGFSGGIWGDGYSSTGGSGGPWGTPIGGDFDWTGTRLYRVKIGYRGYERR